MGKKLVLTGYWVYVHHVYNQLVSKRELSEANGGFPAAIAIANDEWQVKLYISNSLRDGKLVTF